MGKDRAARVADVVTGALVSAAMEIPDLVISADYGETRGIWRVVTGGCAPGTVRIAYAMYVSNDIDIIDGYRPTVIISTKRRRSSRAMPVDGINDTRVWLGDHLPPAGSVPGLDRMVTLLHEASSMGPGGDGPSYSVIRPMLSRILVSMWPRPDLPWRERGMYDRPMGPFVRQPMVAAFHDMLADTDLDDGLPDGFAIQDLSARLHAWHDRFPGDPARKGDGWPGDPARNGDD